VPQLKSDAAKKKERDRGKKKKNMEGSKEDGVRVGPRENPYGNESVMMLSG